MKRLIFCPGVCQVVNACAALATHHDAEQARNEDILVLFGQNPESPYGAAIQQTAEIVWPWKRIVWSGDVLIWYFPTRRFAPIAREVLTARFGADVDEIWVSKLCMDTTKLILYAFPHARVVLYEDGAEEFIPQEITCGSSRWKQLGPRHWPGALWREAGHWNGRPECMEADGVCARDVHRVFRMYSFLADHLDRPAYLSGISVERVDKGKLLECYRDIARASGETPRETIDAGSRPAILFLPQPFATLFLTTEDEFALYRSAVAAIRDKGYAVLWKEHPLEATSLAQHLVDELGPDSLYRLQVKQKIPVEALVAGWKLAGVASVSSTSLFYLHGLYGYPAYTGADRIGLDRWLTATDRALAELAMRSVPGLDQLPAA